MLEPAVGSFLHPCSVVARDVDSCGKYTRSSQQRRRFCDNSVNYGVTRNVGDRKENKKYCTELSIVTVLI